jgi:NUMOD4 motif/HNH endonuclease
MMGCFYFKGSANMNEVWKDVVGYEGKYQVSNLGKVRSLDRYYPHNKGNGQRLQPGKVMKFDITHRGYATVVFYKNDKRLRYEVHALVAAAFLGKRPAKYHAHHKNHNKLDNRAANLTYIDGGKHAKHHNQGENFYAHKLTEKDVKEIRKRLAKGETQLSIAGDYGVSRSLVGQIKQGRTWTHI